MTTSADDLRQHHRAIILITGTAVTIAPSPPVANAKAQIAGLSNSDPTRPMDHEPTAIETHLQAPPKKNLGHFSQVLGKPRRNFRTNPELIWRGGNPHRERLRIMPRWPGWRPYSPRACVSAEDVAVIRQSTWSARKLSELYGVSMACIRGLKSGRRGSGVRRAEDELDPAAISRDLAAEILAALRRAERRLAEARRRDRLARACDQEVKPKAVPTRRYPLKYQTKRAWAP
jgi:hypothetical protein